MKQNGDIYQKMLDSTYELEAGNDEAKKVYIKNLQNFLCAGLATENVPCIPTYQEGLLSLAFKLENNTHICQSKMLEAALESYEKRTQIYQLTAGEETRTVTITETQETPKRIEEDHPKKYPVQGENKDSQKKDSGTIEEAQMPKYKRIKVDHDVSAENLWISWTGQVSDIHVDVNGERFRVEVEDEQETSIFIQAADKGTTIRLSFDGEIEDFSYEWEEKSIPKDMINERVKKETELEINEYAITVKDLVNQSEDEQCKITVMPLEITKDSPCSILVVTEDEDETREVYYSKSSPSVENISIGNHTFLVAGAFEDDEFVVDIYGQNGTGNREQYYIDVQEKKWRKNTPHSVVGHPMQHIVLPKADAIVHVMPLGKENSTFDDLAPIGMYVESTIYKDEEKQVVEEVRKECFVTDYENEVNFEVAGAQKNAYACWEDKKIKVYVE